MLLFLKFLVLVYDITLELIISFLYGSLLPCKYENMQKMQGIYRKYVVPMLKYDFKKVVKQLKYDQLWSTESGYDQLPSFSKIHQIKRKNKKDSK